MIYKRRLRRTIALLVPLILMTAVAYANVRAGPKVDFAKAFQKAVEESHKPLRKL
jgi:hypothetical protein